MNTLSREEVMKYSRRIFKLTSPLNDLLKEAYEAGVKDIDVDVKRDYPVVGNCAPIILVSCFNKCQDL